MRIEQGHVMRLHPGQHVIAQHHRYAQARQAQLTRHPQHGLAGGQGMRGTHVGHDARALAHTGRQHRAHALLQQGVVAPTRILAATQLRQRDGALGQALEHQHVERAALGQVPGRIDAVARVAGAGTDAEGFHANHYFIGLRCHGRGHTRTPVCPDGSIQQPVGWIGRLRPEF